MATLRRHEKIVFTNPTTKEKAEAKILEEIWAREIEDFSEVAPENKGWRECAFVAQLAEWPEGGQRVRITYWGRNEGTDRDSWRFLGQYAPSMSIEEFRELLRKLNEAHW